MTNLLDPEVLLAAYDSQLRAREGEWDGPVRRITEPYGFVESKDLGGLEGAELDELIARQVEFFAARNQKFEWKTRGHDLPADLPQRLLAAGFEPEERETVVVGLAEAMVSGPAPEGVQIRETSDPEDFDRIAEMKTVVWETDMGWIPPMLREELPSGNLKIYVAEADGKVVSAAWIRFEPGTDFAGLWGGSTLKEYRGRGIYKALVAVRARDAVERGYKYLQVDASDDSRPILQRLGFVVITTTTPYNWSPTVR